jgi:transcriptional regulator with XRE-family HTH domain
MTPATTFVRRVREGTNSRQADAAGKLGLNRATLNAYESGRVVPSERRLWRLLEVLALGEAVPGDRPVLLVSFSLLGQRFLSWDGRLLSFSAIENARRVADELDECELERVVIVPVWPSAVDELLRARRPQDISSAGLAEFETLGRSLEDVLAESLDEAVRDVAPDLARLSTRVQVINPDGST